MSLYDSAMGRNASTGLGSADHHSLQDMKSMEADDRPTEDTNWKLLFPATKTLHTSTAYIVKYEEILNSLVSFVLFNYLQTNSKKIVGGQQS